MSANGFGYGDNNCCEFYVWIVVIFVLIAICACGCGGYGNRGVVPVYQPVPYPVGGYPYGGYRY
jgi:hypothetical protein